MDSRIKSSYNSLVHIVYTYKRDRIKQLDAEVVNRSLPCYLVTCVLYYYSLLTLDIYLTYIGIIGSDVFFLSPTDGCNIVKVFQRWNRCTRQHLNILTLIHQSPRFYSVIYRIRSMALY